MADMMNSDHAGVRRSAEVVGHGRALIAAAVVLGFLIVVLVIVTADTQAENQASVAGGWTPIFEETFEAELGSEWSVSDVDGATNGE